MLLNKSYYKTNFALALPIILSSIGQSFTQMVDTIMVGRLGATELAGVAFAGSVSMNVLVFGMGIAMALTPLTGQGYARKEHRKISMLFQNSLALNTIIGLIIIGILFLIFPFLGYFGQTQEVIDICKPYYIIISISFLPSLIFLTFKQFLEGIGNTKNAMIITITANVINIILNYLLIYGKLGFPALGIIGAGIATLIAKTIMPIIFLIFILNHKTFKKYFLFFSWSRFSFNTQKIILRLGMPISGQMFLEFSSLLFITIMMGWVSKYALAGYHVVITIVGTTFLIATGLSNATTVLISHAFGKKDYNEIWKNFKAGYHLTLITMGFFAIILFVFGGEIAKIFSPDEKVVEIAKVLFIVAGFFQLIDGSQVLFLGALRGINDVAKPMKYAFISYILIALPFAYICGFVFDIGFWSIFAGFSVGLSIAAILYFRRFRLKINSFKKEIETIKE